MRMVEFLVPMRPFAAGDQRVLPDAAADALIAAGEARPVDSVFDRQREPVSAITEGYATRVRLPAEPQDGYATRAPLPRRPGRPRKEGASE